MKKKIEFLEIIKWFGSLLLLALSILSIFVLSNDHLYIKGLTVFIVILAALCIVCTTVFGKWMIIFIKESYIELQKVVWPTYQDSFNTTLIVIIVAVIIALILWGLDTILLNIVSFGLRL